MSDGDALLRTILERPDDDTARLVYADWLQENGDEEIAEFVRDGVFARKPVRLVRQNLPLRSDDAWGFGPRLSRIARASGLPDLPAKSVALFARGFVSEIRLTLAAFMQHAEALFRAHPIKRVTLTDQRPLESSRFAWFNQRVPPGPSQPVPHRLPDELYVRLDGYDNRSGAHPNNVRWYNTRDGAEAALSRACVAYGRELAGLSKMHTAA